METLTIIFSIGSKFSYSQDVLKVFEKEYYCDLSEQNLNNIFVLMTNFDGTLARKIKRGETFEWKIQFSDNQIKSSRFQSLLPYLFLSKKLEKVLYDFQKDGVNWLLNDDSRSRELNNCAISDQS